MSWLMKAVLYRMEKVINTVRDFAGLLQDALGRSIQPIQQIVHPLWEIFVRQNAAAPENKGKGGCNSHRSRLFKVEDPCFVLNCLHDRVVQGSGRFHQMHHFWQLLAGIQIDRSIGTKNLCIAFQAPVTERKMLGNFQTLQGIQLLVYKSLNARSVRWPSAVKSSSWDEPALMSDDVLFCFIMIYLLYLFLQDRSCPIKLGFYRLLGRPRRSAISCVSFSSINFKIQTSR